MKIALNKDFNIYEVMTNRFIEVAKEYNKIAEKEGLPLSKDLNVINGLNKEVLRDGKPVSMKELFEKIYNDKNELDAELESAKNEIKKLQDDNTRLRKALSEYINKENTVDSALTASVELLSHQLQHALDEISKLKDKTKYL